MEKRGSGLTRICNETKALEGYKDELKPMFKSTPTQFQTVIFASSDTQNVGDHDGDVSERKLTERQQKIPSRCNGKCGAEGCANGRKSTGANLRWLNTKTRHRLQPAWCRGVAALQCCSSKTHKMPVCDSFEQKVGK